MLLNLKQVKNILISTDLDSTVQSLDQLNRNRRHTFLSMIFEHLVYYPTPSALSYLWGFGSLAGIFLCTQILTGIILVMHYKPSTLDAFSGVVHFIYDVPSGWLLRYLHANGASMFFIIVYLHIGRGLYYSSFMTPRNWLWITGIILFFLMMGTSFIGYVLPWGQISFWGATVITNLVSAIPVVGERIVYWIWGNFSIGDATLNRFFSLHYLLPFILLIVVIIHLSLLHNAGSNNPIGLSTRNDLTKLPFYPFFYLKDVFGFLVFCLLYLYLVFFDPNLLGHSDNYIEANPMVTPPHIVPEWYFLPFYAILRAIPNKFGGVVIMVTAILMGLFHATMQTFKYWLPDAECKRSLYFLPISTSLFWIFIGNFFLLGFIGGRPVETPYFEVGQISTIFFFLYWLIAPVLYTVEQQLFVIKNETPIAPKISSDVPQINTEVIQPVTNFPYKWLLLYIGYLIIIMLVLSFLLIPDALYYADYSAADLSDWRIYYCTYESFLLVFAILLVIGVVMWYNSEWLLNYKCGINYKPIIYYFTSYVEFFKRNNFFFIVIFWLFTIILVFYILLIISPVVYADSKGYSPLFFNRSFISILKINHNFSYQYHHFGDFRIFTDLVQGVITGDTVKIGTSVTAITGATVKIFKHLPVKEFILNIQQNRAAYKIANIGAAAIIEAANIGAAASIKGAVLGAVATIKDANIGAAATIKAANIAAAATIEAANIAAGNPSNPATLNKIYSVSEKLITTPIDYEVLLSPPVDEHEFILFVFTFPESIFGWFSLLSLVLFMYILIKLLSTTNRFTNYQECWDLVKQDWLAVFNNIVFYKKLILIISFLAFIILMLQFG